jgi:hypothetical protein
MVIRIALIALLTGGLVGIPVVAGAAVESDPPARPAVTATR